MKVCARCEMPAVILAGSIGTGYATLRDGREVCYSCADEMQREEMRTANIAYVYLASDGHNVTTWTGGELALVTRESEHRTGFHGCKLTSVRAVAPDGSRWYGKGAGRGMCLKLRRSKSSPLASSLEGR